MHLFVTGATGFIGSHFTESALEAGHQVTALHRPDRSDSPTHARLRRLGADLRRGNVLDAASLREAMAGSECVCHFAAAFREAVTDEEHFRRVNVEGTANLLQAARVNGVRRFVLCSTAGIYGRRVPGIIDESYPPRPFNAYERSKVAAEEEVRRAAAAFGMEYVILRPTAVYGPRDQRLMKLFRSAAKGRFPLFGPGEGRRHMVYVSDLADAFLRACQRPSAANQEMIIAGPEAVPLRDMLAMLADLVNRRSCGPRFPLMPMLALAAATEDVCNRLGIRPPLYRRRMDFYTNDAAYDCSRARSVLGWEPKVSLREGLARTLEFHEHASGAAALARVVCLAGVFHAAHEGWTRALMASMA